MAPIVVPGVCRYSVHQRLGGQNVVNIIDMQIDTTGSNVSREDAIHGVAGDIINNWSDHILVEQRADLVAEEVRWLDLNSLTGSTGARNSTDGETWPKAGSLTGSAVMPAIVSLRVDKSTTGGRGTKRGRMYIAGVTEDATDAGVSQTWRQGVIDVWNDNLAEFLSGINDQDIGGLPLDVQRQMVVVHSVTETYSDVESLTVNPNIASQVRRGVLR